MRARSASESTMSLLKLSSTASASGHWAFMNKARQCCWLPARMTPKRSVISPRSGAINRSLMLLAWARVAYLPCWTTWRL
jgi:hypothetical protein